jgi:hypothetical protein
MYGFYRLFCVLGDKLRMLTFLSLSSVNIYGKTSLGFFIYTEKDFNF